jgi:hypothetical protein
LPCSRWHARLAADIAVNAGRLLPYPFTPHRATPKRTLAGLLSVAVVVTEPCPILRPHLLFRGAIAPTRLPRLDGSQEVPLPVLTGSDDAVALDFSVKLQRETKVSHSISLHVI